MQMDPKAIRLQVENLKLIHPEILEDDEAWLATLESETDFNEILTTIVRRIEDTKALAEGTGSRMEELKARKDRFLHRIESLRDLLFKLMESAELSKLELSEATISVRKGQPQLIGEADAEALLPQFRRVSVTPDKAAIKDAIKAGQTVPGFQLSNSPPSLSIRIK